LFLSIPQQCLSVDEPAASRAYYAKMLELVTAYRALVKEKGIFRLASLGGRQLPTAVVAVGQPTNQGGGSRAGREGQGGQPQQKQRQNQAKKKTTTPMKQDIVITLEEEEED